MQPSRADRPWMPGYGIPDASVGGGLLPWEWALTRLEAAHNYWVASRSADGQPHIAAVWGIWAEGGLCFSTGGRSRKARNLLSEARCSVAPEGAEHSVVVEGRAERVAEPGAIAAALARYKAKYGEGFPDPADNPLFLVRPVKVLGVIEHPGEFAARATRWHFD